MEQSKTILFLPFLQIPSGHHQAADAIIEEVSSKHKQIHCKKIDILSYSYGKVEALVSNTYLKWIKTIPALYNWMYQINVYKNMQESKRFRLYEVLFIRFMRRLIKENQPDLIICSHALPSYMLDRLKEKGEINTPVINIYTDYFIHQFWGTNNIDFHFVPSQPMKDFLKQKKGLRDEQIFITGIPIHPKIQKQRELSSKPNPSKLSLLITGGSLGVGEIEELVRKIGENSKITFYVLCGKNKYLYNKIVNKGKNNVIPLEYIQCKDEMNKLYDQIDGIITKPGGVTISESLFKRKPIFIYHALPGQEVINLQQLTSLGLCFDINSWKTGKETFDDFIHSFFKEENNGLLEDFHKSLSIYHKQISEKNPTQIIEGILNGRNFANV